MESPIHRLLRPTSEADFADRREEAAERLWREGRQGVPARLRGRQPQRASSEQEQQSGKFVRSRDAPMILIFSHMALLILLFEGYVRVY